MTSSDTDLQIVLALSMALYLLPPFFLVSSFFIELYITDLLYCIITINVDIVFC